MEFLRTARRKSLLSEIIYIGLNIALAGLVLLLVVTTGTPWAALLLVVLSKWRIFAVRPRYWFAHVESNMVDVIVGVGTVLLMYTAGQIAPGGALLTQIILAVLYVLWLLLLKPRSKHVLVSLQAAVAVVVGTMAVASVSYEWWSSAFVLFMWLIGYAAARHVLYIYSDEHTRYLSLIWGVVFAELGWVSYYLLVTYELPFGLAIKVPEITLILIGLSFVAERIFASQHANDGEIKRNDILMPVIFVTGLIAVLLLLFTSVSIGTV